MKLPQLLYRVTGLPFYQRHAGLFLFIFIILFGVVQGNQLISYHLSLMYAMLGSPLFMLVVSLIWLLYAMKCYQFTAKTLAEQQNQFLYITAAQDPKLLLGALLSAQCFIYLPVLIYALLLVLLGIYSGQFAAAAYVAVFHTAICLASAFRYRYHLHHPAAGRQLFHYGFLRFRFRKNIPAIFVSQLLKEMKVIFMVTKFFSVTIIIAFLNGFFIDSYDSRVVMLGFLAGITAHCVLVFEFRRFEETLFMFYRTLPFNSFIRWLNLTAVYLIILMPEWLIFSMAIPDRLHVGDSLWLPFFGAALLMAYHCLLYKPPLDMEKYLQWVFSIAAVLFFLLLYKWYLIMIVLLSMLSIFYFRKWYLRFELTEGQL